MDKFGHTAESRKFEVLQTGYFVRAINSSNYREVTIQIYKPQNQLLSIAFSDKHMF